VAEPLYKIMPARDWTTSRTRGAVAWADVDHRDGFVHLSAARQVRGTVEAHFAGHPDLVLVAIDPARLTGEVLRWEASRGGDRFPHVYGEIPITAVLAVHPLADGDGVVTYPNSVEG
jgi:uncharacterized protein (DUF952 family)